MASVKKPKKPRKGKKGGCGGGRWLNFNYRLYGII